MRRYLRSSRAGKPRGTALAVAMLVIVLLSGIGVIALNAATYDVASAGAIRQGDNASTVSQAGLAVGRCEMCEGIDGLVHAMREQRLAGLAPQFHMTGDMLEQGLPVGQNMFYQGADDERDSFGLFPSGAHPTRTDINVVIDRGTESGNAAGFSMVESAGSDSASFCFRNYRVTSTGTYVPYEGFGNGTQDQHRSYITAGPIQCTD